MADIIYNQFKMENFYKWLAYKLPPKLVYFCYVRFLAHATTFEEGAKLHPDEVKFHKAVELWERKYGK